MSKSKEFDADTQAFLNSLDAEIQRDDEYQAMLETTVSDSTDASVFDTPEINESLDAFLAEGAEDEIADDQLSAWLDVPLQVVGGFRDAADSIKNLAISGAAATGIPQKAAELITGEDIPEEDVEASVKRVKKKTALPEVQEPETIAGEITRPISQFLLPFGAATKGVQALGVAGKAAPIIGGAISDFVAFDEHEERFSNVLKDLGVEDPLGLIDSLAAEEDDGVIEGRLKNVIEGGVLGGVVTGVAKGAKRLSPPVAQGIIKGGKYIVNGKRAKNAIKTARDETAKQTKKIKAAVNRIKQGRLDDIDVLKFRPNKEEVSEVTQKRMADFVELSPEELKQGKVFDEIRKSGLQDKLNKVTVLQDEGYERLKGSLEGYLARVDSGDLNASDEFIRNEFSQFLELDGAAKDTFQDAARALGLRGRSESVVAANQMTELLGQANKLTKDQLVKAVGGIAGLGGDVPTFLKNMNTSTRLGKVKDVVNEWYVNSILSSPKTLLVDTFSNPIWNTVLVAEKVPAAAIGKMRQGIFHKMDDAVQFQEATAMFDSMMASIGDGFRYTVKAFQRETDRAVKFEAVTGKKLPIRKDIGSQLKNLRLDVQTRFDTPRSERAISAESFGKERDSMLGRSIDFLGNVINAPTEYMQAKDDVAKSLLYRAEAKALAHRRAALEGLTGDAYKARVQALSDVPMNAKGLNSQNMKTNRLTQIAHAMEGDDTELIRAAIAREAQTFAQEGTFTNELGPIAKSLQTFLGELPGGRVVVPFIKTPTNIMKAFGVRSPLAPLAKSVRQDLAAGGARADMAVGRMAMGSSLMAMGWSWAIDGTITGEGPKDFAEKNLLMETGWRPRSAKIGDKYIEIGRLDPIASFFLFPANLVELYDQMDGDITGDLEKDVSDYVSLGVLAGSKMFLSKSFTRGAAELVDTINSENENKFQRLLNFYGSSFVVPNAASFVGNEINPIIQQADTLWETIQVKAGVTVRQRRNVFGEPIMRDPQTIGYMIPSSHSQITNDPLTQKLLASGAYLRIPEKRIKGVELTADQHERLMEIMLESNVRGSLERVTGTPFWERLPEATKTGVDGIQAGTKSGVVKMVYNQFVKGARAKLLQEDDGLRIRVKEYERKLTELPAGSKVSQRVLQSQKAEPITFNPLGGQ